MLFHLWRWVLVHLSQQTGTSNSASRAYDFWSGFGSDLQEFAVFVVGYHYVRERNCHVHRCPSLRTHPVPGTPYKACRRHHPAIPDGRITAEQIAVAHEGNRAQ